MHRLVILSLLFVLSALIGCESKDEPSSYSIKEGLQTAHRVVSEDDLLDQRIAGELIRWSGGYEPTLDELSEIEELVTYGKARIVFDDLKRQARGREAQRRLDQGVSSLNEARDVFRLAEGTLVEGQAAEQFNQYFVADLSEIRSLGELWAYKEALVGEDEFKFYGATREAEIAFWETHDRLFRVALLSTNRPQEAWDYYGVARERERPELAREAVDRHQELLRVAIARGGRAWELTALYTTAEEFSWKSREAQDTCHGYGYGCLTGLDEDAYAEIAQQALSTINALYADSLPRLNDAAIAMEMFLQAPRQSQAEEGSWNRYRELRNAPRS